MAETYCGKNCTECEKKEVLNCPGCKNVPVRNIGENCQIAKCCASKGHEQCVTCAFSDGCAPLRSRDRVPEYRLKRMEEEAFRQESIARRAPVLGKWLWILFWLVIPSNIASLMTNETLMGIVPKLYVPGLLLGAATSAVYGVILLFLRSEEERYQTAGICVLVHAAAELLVAFLSPSGEAPMWTLAISIPASVVYYVGMYHEYSAHCTVLTGVNNLLSDKWMKLWKWTIGSFCALLGCLILAVIAPLLAILVITASAIALIVVIFLRIVYLYQTADAFRSYRKNEKNKEFENEKNK